MIETALHKVVFLFSIIIVYLSHYLLSVNVRLVWADNQWEMNPPLIKVSLYVNDAAHTKKSNT